jgi:hypothetical protein
VTRDTELESWQQEWREHTEPLPELKKKIKRQNLRTAVRIAAVGIGLVLSTTAAWLGRGSFVSGLAAGMWFASIVMGGYAWRVRRGAWRPSAQTTLAYAELAYKRALAKARILRFAFYFLLTAAVLFAGFAAWIWKTASDQWLLALVVAGMVAELILMRYFARRNLREVEKSKKLLDQTGQGSDVLHTER